MLKGYDYLAFVQCKYCGKNININIEPNVIKVSGNEYAHKKCALEYEKNKNDEDELRDYIKKLFEIDFIPALMKIQLEKFDKEYHFTNAGILQALKYWYEVKKESIEKANDSLGIVPYIYKEADKYYTNIREKQKLNEDKNIEDYKPKKKTITITPPEPQREKPRLFFEEEDSIWENLNM